MKKIIFYVLLIIPFSSFGQGNLQFNQILDLTNGANYTVPAGKVVKVTSVNSPSGSFTGNFVGMPAYEYPTYESSGNYYINCNCQYRATSPICIGTICIDQFIFNNGTSRVNYTSNPLTGIYAPSDTVNKCSATAAGGYTLSASQINMPIWLSAGQQITIVNGFGVLISAIEFNVVP